VVIVVAGLDPAIQVDARVKHGYGGGEDAGLNRTAVGQARG
jgi:hypothetical protein